MKKLYILALAGIMAMALLGAGYAMWSDTLTIDGTVNTGSLDIDLSGPYLVSDTEPPEKDVSNIACYIDPLNENNLVVTITGAYPSIVYTCVFDVTSAGTVPAHVSFTKDNGNLPATTDYNWAFTDAAGATVSVDPYIQLHEGNSVYVTLTVHLNNDSAPGAGDGAAQNASYTFGGTIFGKQWNE